MIQLRPVALGAWTLAYLPVYVIWAVALTTCAEMEPRWGAAALLAVIGLVVAIGASTTEVDYDEERPIELGITTWVVALGGLVSAGIFLNPFVMFALLLVAAIGAGRGSEPMEGGLTGVIVAIAAVLGALGGAAVLRPVVDAAYGPVLGVPADSQLGDVSLALVAGGIPAALGMAAIHVLPRWRGGVGMAAFRGALCAGVLTAFAIDAVFVCGK